MIELRTLGCLELNSDEGADFSALLAQPKRFAILAYLALRTPGVMHRRDTLLSLFWPELDQAHARTALRSSLAHIRHVLGDGVVMRQGDEAVGINPKSLCCDVAAFEIAVDQGAWDTAFDLYRGDFLEGFYLRDAIGFERWADNERTRLQEVAAAAAWGRAHLFIRANQLVDAERTAQRALSLVPTAESEVREFIQALAGAGDRASAVRFFEKFAQRLRDEYELEPSPETRSLVEDVRARATANGPIPVAPAVPPVGAAAEAAAEKREGPDSSLADKTARSSRSESRGVGLYAAAVAAVVIVGGVALWSLTDNETATPPPASVIRTVASVAVLPFSDLGEVPEQDHFADGLTEDLVTRLSQVRALRVISSGAAARYAEQGVALSELGIQLGVGAVVRGTVRRQGDSVRIVAHLIDINTGEYLWAASYDRRLTHLFAVQGDIAVSIASALSAVVSDREEERLRSVPTLNLTAWEYTEAARVAVLTRRGEDRANIPPARAHALRSMFFTNSAGGGTDMLLVDSAIAAARRAIALDPEDHMGHAALGYAKRYSQIRYDQLQPLVRAIELAPSAPSARGVMGAYYSTSGRIDLQYGWKVLSDLDHENVAAPTDTWAQWIVGDYERAEHTAQMRVAIDPTGWAYGLLAKIYLSQGKVSEARAAEGAPSLIAALIEIFAGDYETAKGYLEAAMNQDPPILMPFTNGVRTTTALAYALIKLGETERAPDLLQRSIEMDRELIDGGISFTAHPYYDLARVYAIQGNVSEANRWLREALDNGWPFAYTYMGLMDPMLENLKGNETFETMMDEARAALDRQRERMMEMDTLSRDELITLLLAEAHAELKKLRREEGNR
jgi:serine/threonine-protein kinase